MKDLKYAALERVLQPGQEYILDYSEKFEKDIKAVEHEIATDTCFEKADLLGWAPINIVKCVFLSGKEGKFYGFVAPELGERRNSPLRFDNQQIAKIFNKKTMKQMGNLSNSMVPLGMEKGTCTPLVPDYYFNGDGFIGSLEKIFVYDSSKLNKELVDISIGGYGKEAHKISVHLNYEDIYGCLNWKFPGKIEKFNL